MKRELIAKLREWKESRRRKPLLLVGARQVGKTWLLQEFGRENYREVAYVSFDRSEPMRQSFEQDFDVQRILTNIGIYTGCSPKPGETLIILDEIQECPAAITSLKYFCENAREFHVVAAGSLLGLYAREGGTGFPVGKVDMLDMYPMSFTEFLTAMGYEQYVRAIRQHDWEGLRVMGAKLEEMLRYYYYVGGMPEVVADFAETRDFVAVRTHQTDILRGYQQDFGKHTTPSEAQHIAAVWKHIPDQLSQERKEFSFKRPRRVYPLEWLEAAGLVHRVPCVRSPQIPLSAFPGESYKVYTTDVGLLSAQCHLDRRVLLEKNAVFGQFKGALTEQYVLQQLLASGESELFYWKAERAQAEVEFLLQTAEGVVPVEVKAERNLQAKSLKSYCKRYGVSRALRCSMSPFSLSQTPATSQPSYSLLDLPLWAAGELPRIAHDFPHSLS